MVNGRAFKPSDWLTEGVPIVRIQNLNNPQAPFNYCSPSALDEKHRIQTGSFLISWSGTPGTSFGAFIWERGPAALNQHIFRCAQRTPVYYEQFLRLAINTRLDELIAKAHGGVGLQHVTKGKLEALSLVLPPLPEQHRIVARVDELMALCDRLEAEQADAAEAHARLVDALLAPLTASRDAAECATNWQRLHKHFDTLFTTEASITALKQTALQLAVMGRLVPQDPNDGERLEGQFGDFADFLNGHAFKSSWFTKSGVRLVRNANVGHGICNWKDVAYISNDQAREFEKFALLAGDLVLSLDRPIISSGLKVAWINAQDTPCLLLQRVAKVVPSTLIDIEYLYLWFNSPLFIDSIDPGRSNGVPHISTKQVLGLPFVCPPLPEQHRIVAKVDELMALCDRLQAKLATAREHRARLADTLVQAALEAA
ncbi:MAG: restriction endonuclease subunit S [Rhodocyclaceae bacterium]